ncbi:ATP-dependent helicase [Sporosarcina limicola]|uniref:DNA 3'-5' helicase n=1 Tax=Sporosarcina limicola TaxID=34101 RepID=A0A927RDK9_9BACL|nr:ATP-dependent helicase [Sporosarcina limicola]MBE1555435.1 DNA helicase-2/ATP-dependent DNA helicase PcrA [Sporosarcina limicola]
MANFFERKKKELNIELNEVQKKAVLQTEGPLLLLACPGSGKTTTMIMRIGYLIEEKGIQPNRIKAITFSKASARDMTERFGRFFPRSTLVDFSTIHSLAFTIARTYLNKIGTTYELIEGNGRGKQPINKHFLLKGLYKEVLHEECTDDELGSLSTFISSIKNKMIPLEKWEELDGPIDKAGRIALKYEQYKTRTNGHLLLDFDDMLTIAVGAFKEDEELAALFRNRYDYLLTDESQDTSLVQHKIVEHLVAHHSNLCVVADDDQSIYTWRGAEPDYLLDFKKVYPDAHVLMMERNYRSSKEIVELTAQFIKRNKKRYPKEMQTENSAVGPIGIRQLEDPKRQLEYVTYELLGETNLKEVAILFRNNSSSTMFVNELHRRGIPFYMKDADDKFFSHWIVEDVLNFMRLSFNTERKDIFAKLIMKMNLFISRNMLTQFENTKTKGNVFDAFIQTVDLRDNQIKKLKEYKEVYAKIPEMRPDQVIRMIRYELEYENSLKSRAEKFGFRIESLLGILDTLEGIASQLRTMVEFANRLKELEQAVQNAKFNPSENAVTLSTFHSAKGLEFRRVFMIDLLNGIIPSEEDEGNEAALEEARRLFYVGMTRAKEKLELLSYSKSDGKPKEDSKFLNEVRGLLMKPGHAENNRKPVRIIATEIPLNPNGIDDSDELTVGTVVKHRVFGCGEIIKCEGNEVHIQFDKMEKRLDLEILLSKRLLEKVAI